jgi:predicted phosphodiesterase
MRLAFLSDIHGNLPALRAAVADAKKRGAEGIYCAGDLVGYGPFPDEVCRYIAESKITTISGNYDAKALSILHDADTFKTVMKPGKLKILTWSARRLSEESKQFISLLPTFHAETLPGGLSLLMVHGSPLSWEDVIYPSITRFSLEKKLGERTPDILVCGHTHIPFVKKISGIAVINCGSAGQPVDGDPSPSYALLDIDKTGNPKARVIRFSYPIEELVEAIRTSSLPFGLADDFINGRKKREKI